MLCKSIVLYHDAVCSVTCQLFTIQ